MLETNPIFGERMELSFDNYIRFNANITKRYIKNIVKNECILFIHTNHYEDARKIINKIKHFRLKGAMSRVCVWCTGETKKQFKKRILKELKDA